MQIRPFTPDDYTALVQIDNENFPDHLETEEQMRWGDDHREPNHKWARFIAEVDGKVVGSGGYGQEGGMYHPRKFFVMVSVSPNVQGQGIGRALYDHAINALAPFDPLSVRSFARENMDRPVRFLQDRGFVEDMRFWESELDLSTFDFAPFDGAEEKPIQHGITVKTQAELMESDPNWKRNAYELAQAISRDIPRPEPWTPTEFSVWEQRLDHPDKLPDANFIALDGDKWVGISSLHKCQTEGVIETGVTGTLPEYRRKGIALSLKLRAVRYALAHGFRTIRTGNETGNRPMLSINEAMGYVKKPAWVTFVKVLQTEDTIAKDNI